MPLEAETAKPVTKEEIQGKAHVRVTRAKHFRLQHESLDQRAQNTT